MYYIAMDGGGTKLVGILFDDQYRLISSARADGTHLSVHPIDTVKAHIMDCYTRLFAELPRPLVIEGLYTICGDTRLYAELLPADVTLKKTRNITEAVSGLYAGSACHSGFVALSGTGSDVFCIREDQCTDVIGGWGAILGDEGSGVWMARHAMHIAIRAEQGWGEPTVFGDMVKNHFGFSQLWDYVGYLYATPSPFRRIGELMPLIAQAANRGDEPMLEVLRRGGRIMARQMIALLDRNPDMEQRITACGGAWKAHPAMAKAFTDALAAAHPAAVFTLPRFEHIMAGPICHAMERGLDLAEVTNHLAATAPQFCWNQAGHSC